MTQQWLLEISKCHFGPWWFSWSKRESLAIPAILILTLVGAIITGILTGVFGSMSCL